MRVPLSVVYDVEHDKITTGRVYFEVPAFLRQVGQQGRGHMRKTSSGAPRAR